MSAILAILSAVVNSLWQAVAVAALVWLALRFVPRINAATRYAIWWGTLGVVLILPVAPRLIPMMRPHPQPAAVTAVKTPITAAPTVTVEPVIVTVTPGGRTGKWPIAILAVWAAILLWRLGQIVRSYFYLRGVKRRSTVSPIPLPAIPRRADLLISPDIVSPMAVGFLRPAIVLPDSLLEELSEPEREHVLLHESAHLAKYDDWSNLAMRVLAGALALHPVAIWILWRIEREREMACDDWVVARTGAARSYAASLAHLFELRRARRGEILASGIFGSSSRIGDRIEMLLRRGRTFSPRASAVGIAASTVVLGALMLAGSFAPRWIAFAQQAPQPSFEVASVKRNTSGGDWDTHSGPPESAGFRANNMTLKMLIKIAYRVKDSQISGGPGWIDSDRYDIAARLAENNLSADRSRLMLQTLLEERFRLALRREMRTIPVYALIASSGGLQLPKSTHTSCVEFPAGSPPTPSAPGQAPSIPCGGFVTGPNLLEGGNISMSEFVDVLGNMLDRPVVDKTGFTGTFTVRLDFNSEGIFGRHDDSNPDNPRPSIFTAIHEQLGLRLEPQKGPVEVLVINHVEKPNEN
jgi:uncharacterized protein (TIGR03435 family)